MRYMLLSLVLSSTLILYENGDHSGQQLVRTTSDPTLVNDGWNDRVSAIRVTGGCQWILYQDSNYDGTSSVIGPGDQNYHHTIFGIPNDELSSVRCLPPSNFRALALFQHDLYRGNMRVLCSSSQNLVGFDNTVSSFIINMGVWQLYSGTNYTGSSVSRGPGHYPDSSALSPIANDDLSSVRLGKLILSN